MIWCLKDFAFGFLGAETYCTRFWDLLFCITLCQGAANHYAVCNGYATRYSDPTRMGIKDFDIWVFFRKQDEMIFNRRWIGRKDWHYTKFRRNLDGVGFIGRRVEFKGRSITFEKMGVECAVRRWVRSSGGVLPRFLSRKAVVGLYPEEVLGKVIWINPRLV